MVSTERYMYWLELNCVTKDIFLNLHIYILTHLLVKQNHNNRIEDLGNVHALHWRFKC